MTNREVYEDVAGMNLDRRFFEINGIDPDAEYVELEDILEAPRG